MKHLANLWSTSRLCYPMFVLFAAVVYPHYYSWWSYFNAWNDDFYSQWYHQAFFSSTELVSTIFVIHFCNKSNERNPQLLLVIISIAVLHILASGVDQLIENVFMGKGKWHQVSRDLGFMVPDLLHIVIPFYEIWSYARKNNKTIRKCFRTQDIIVAIVGIVVLLGLCRSL